MIDHFIEVEVSSQRTPKERKIEQLMAELKSGDSVIVSELLLNPRNLTGESGLI